MIIVNELIDGFTDLSGEQKLQPWEIINNLSSILADKILSLNDDYDIQ